MNEEEHAAHEKLVHELNDPMLRAQYAAPYDNYQPCLVARVLGSILVTSGDLVYGSAPSLAKFKAIEVIARIPYQSWEVATYTLLTALYKNEKRAIELAKTSTFSRCAQDNETLHVVIISQIVCKLKAQSFLKHTLVPLFFSLFYFWTIYILYMFSKRASLELNYLFENHAYEQYSEYLLTRGHELKHRLCDYEFMDFYGRKATSEYEFFELVRNDELVHRNRSIRELEMRAK
ncbi:MAG TPA: hypothetical protein VFY28_01535 [Candidatus Paceibacterota bacterium]|nr:hypothetical protein [Candidatus Paceibacterota bacterium]